MAYRMFGHVQEAPWGHYRHSRRGQDLQFLITKNEIAQSEAHSGKAFAHYWMHNGYINIDGIKMSKSFGQLQDGEDLLQVYDGEVLRF